ncbi:hypothetical protein D3C81_942850 [compost metagenome]
MRVGVACCFSHSNSVVLPGDLPTSKASLLRPIRVMSAMDGSAMAMRSTPAGRFQGRCSLSSSSTVLAGASACASGTTNVGITHAPSSASAVMKEVALNGRCSK